MTDQIKTFENSHGRRSDLKIVEGEKVKRGFEGDKMHVYANLFRGRKTRKVPMFMKTQENQDEDFHVSEIDVQSVLSKHKLLQDKGFPVVPTLRIDKKNKRILMTDVTEGGGKEIYDLHDYEKSVPRFINSGQLVEDVNRIGNEAFVQGVILSVSAYSIIYDRVKHEGKVMLLDLGEVFTPDEFGSGYDQKKFVKDGILEFLKIMNLETDE
ncbi:hypothetical protein BH10PAT1_BH10PAT1_1320 [soil metagenome]